MSIGQFLSRPRFHSAKTSRMDPVRKRIVDLASERKQALVHVSEAIGKNPAYLQQFIKRGIPAELPEKVRAALASHFGVDETELGGPPRNAAGAAMVPLVSWVSAGGMIPRDGVTAEDVLDVVHAAGLAGGNWFALRVEGDSMDRISPPDSIIFVNRDERRLVPNGLYVIADETGATTYKRYRPAPDRFEPVSVNPSHETIFPRGQVRVIGRVRRTVLDT